VIAFSNLSAVYGFGMIALSSQPFEYRQPAACDELMNRARQAFANPRQILQSFDAFLPDDFIHRAVAIAHSHSGSAVSLHTIRIGQLRFEDVRDLFEASCDSSVHILNR